MRINKLRETIIIEKETVTVDDIGNHKTAFSPYYTCHAYPQTFEKSESGNEVITSSLGITFLVRYTSKLKDLDSVKYRIRFGEDVYNIKSIDFMNYGKREVKIRCEKEVRNGG